MRKYTFIHNKMQRVVKMLFLCFGLGLYKVVVVIYSSQSIQSSDYWQLH